MYEENLSTFNVTFVVRGNIHTRLKKLDDGQFSALILAAAGLERAGLTHRISRYFSPEEMIPAAGQGVLAVQCRKDFPIELLQPIHHRETFLAVTAERSFVKALEGGCSSPVAAYGVVQDEELRLIGQYVTPEGEIHTGSITGAAEDGDWVNIDYSGSVDGTAFDGGTSTGYDLQLGSGTFLAATDDYKGFEEQIVGHKAGEEFDIQVQFPDPYQNNTDLSGKPADFHIVLNKVYAPAELTDEWVASNDDSYTTVDELRKGLKETMQEYYDSQYDSQVKSEIEDKLLETSEVKKYPDGAVDDKVSQIKESYETTVKNYYGMELSDFITSYLKTTEDDFNTKIEEQAKKTVQLEQALRLIAKKEKLELSDKDYEKEMKTYAKNAGADDVDSYKEQVGEDNLKTMILCDKVLDFLVDNCKQTKDASTSTGTSSTGTSSTGTSSTDDK